MERTSLMSHAEYLNDYEAKHQILEVGRRMYEKGFVASNDGNISLSLIHI